LDRELLTIIDKEEEPLNMESTIKVGRGPVGVIGNKEDTYVYVTNMKEGSVSSVDVSRRQVDKVLYTGFNPYCLTFNKKKEHSLCR
jgi:YVTN family beta-propeller protein